MQENEEEGGNYDPAAELNALNEPRVVTFLGREMSVQAYKALVNAGSGLLLFIAGCLCAVAFRYTDVPYFLFFAGWLMRSAWVKANITMKWSDSK